MSKATVYEPVITVGYQAIVPPVLQGQHSVITPTITFAVVQTIAPGPVT